jgi:hypothetical protein
MSETREAWIDMPRFSAILFEGYSEDTREWKEAQGHKILEYDPDLPPVKIEIRYPGRRNSVTFNLTGMTAQELEEFKKFWDYAFEKARPICESLDEKAKEAYDNGDDAYARLYRTIPRFIIRQRSESEHGTGIPSRLERAARNLADQLDGGLPEGPIPDIDSPDTSYRIRTSGSEVPDSEPSDVVTEHNES